MSLFVKICLHIDLFHRAHVGKRALKGECYGKEKSGWKKSIFSNTEMHSLRQSLTHIFEKLETIICWKKYGGLNKCHFWRLLQGGRKHWRWWKEWRCIPKFQTPCLPVSWAWLEEQKLPDTLRLKSSCPQGITKWKQYGCNFIKCERFYKRKSHLDQCLYCTAIQLQFVMVIRLFCNQKVIDGSYGSNLNHSICPDCYDELSNSLLVLI